MSAIRHTSEINKYAYYVHYRAERYLKQQSLPKDGAFSNYAQQKIQTRANLLTSKLSRQTKEEYAKTISALYGRNSGSKINISQEWNKFYKSLMEVLDEKFTSVTGETYMIKESGKIISRGRTDRQVKQTVQRQYLTIDQLKNLNEIVDRINKEKIDISKSIAPKKIQRLNDLLYTLEPLLQKAMKDIDLGINNETDLQNYPSWKRFTGFIRDKKIRFNLGEENKDLLKNLNESLVECGLAYVGLSVAQGFAGETIGAVAAEMLVGLRGQALDKYIEKTAIQEINQKNVTGGKQTRLKYIGVGPEESWLNFLKDDTIREGSTIISKRASQQKVDIIVELPETPETPQILHRANISMKSVDLRYDIGIVSGTNLWYLIQDENITNFLRPFLNIMAGRWGDNETDITQNIDLPIIINAAKEQSISKQIKGLREDAFNAIQIITAYKALSGDTFGRTAANLFVVNDVSGKKTYVLEISDIMKAILNNIRLKKSNINNYFSFSFNSAKDLILKNEWQENLHIRMQQIIQDAHAKKIDIAMKPNILMSDLLGNNKITG